MNIEEKLRKARFRLSKEYPYLGRALFALSFNANKDAPFPMGTDKWYRMYYNPEMCEKMNFDEVKGCMYHEVGHMLRAHFDRCGNRNPQGFNIAGDCEINSSLPEGMVLPKGAVYPKLFKLPDRETSEFYYNRLSEQAKKNGSSPDGQFGESQGQEEGDGDGQQQQSQGGGGSDGKDGQGKKKKKQHKGCGSCADGVKKEWEQGGPDGKNGGVSDTTKKIIQKQVAEDVKQHQKTRGTVPAEWERWAEEVLDPQVNWKDELNTLVRNVMANKYGNSDYSFNIPCRREYGDVISPALVEPHVKACFIIDTSGSMGESELAKALAEVNAIVKGVEGSIDVICADSDVGSYHKNVRNIEDIDLIGGGGTSMVTAIRRANDEDKYDAIIVFTDGYTDFPDEKDVVCPTIFCITEDKIEAPAHCKTITIKE